MKDLKVHERYYYRMQKMKGRDLNYFVAGFVDGESSFSVSMTRQKYAHYAKGWRWIINPVFQVYQHENHADILHVLQEHVFKTGRIRRKSSPYNVFVYHVDNHKTLLEKIIPFFRKYRLATKEEDFEKFADIVTRLKNKEHFSLEGYKRIVDIAFTMNAQGKQRKYSKQDIFSTLPEQFNRL